MPRVLRTVPITGHLGDLLSRTLHCGTDKAVCAHFPSCFCLPL